MNEIARVLLYTTLAGVAIPLGGLVGSIERIHPEWLKRELRHGVLAFGGGILLAAVGLVLVPEGIDHLSAPAALTSLLAGGLCLLVADRELTRRGTPASMLMATLLDYAPEAMALGALIAAEPSVGLLLALFIGLQNLPEGFNSYRELTGPGGLSAAKVLGVLAALVIVGPLFGLLGFWLLSDAPTATGATMMFASGGILYLTFQSIAPQAHLERHWAPALGAVLGFAVGLAGHMLLQG